jgi:hypothetical protein
VTLTAPVEGLLTGAASLRVEGGAEDGAGIARVEVSVAGRAAGTALPCPVALPPGQAEIVVRAWDPAGNEGRAAVSVERDATPPELVLTAPAEGAVTYEGAIGVAGTARDAHLEGVRVVTTPAQIAPDGRFALSVPLRLGANEVAVVARDRAGHETTVTRRVERRERGLKITLAAPADETFTREARVTVRGQVGAEPPEPIATVRVGDREVPVVEGAFAVEVALEEGRNVIEISARSPGGTTAGVRRTVLSDRTAPRVTLTAPRAGATEAERVRVEGRVDDASPVTVSVRVNGAEAASALPAEVALPLGEARIEVWATDAAGNKERAGVTVTREERQGGAAIPGFTFLGQQTFTCANDVEGERRFEVAVYACDAFVAALMRAGKLRAKPARVGEAVDTEFVLLPPAGYGSAKPAWGGKPFLMARTEVSQRVYEALGGQHGKFDWPGDLEPANQVSWNDAQAWFGSAPLKGTGLRLPSEAEWEFACRGGTETEFCFGNGKTVTSKVVNFDGRSPHGGAPTSEYRQRTVAVKSLPANAFGLHEVHGNLYEWCEDLYEQGADWRVRRGGGWYYVAVHCRSSARGWFVPGYRAQYCGFRPSRSAP